MATYKPSSIGRSVGNNSVFNLSQEFIYQSGLSGAVCPFNGWTVPFCVGNEPRCRRHACMGRLHFGDCPSLSRKATCVFKGRNGEGGEVS